MRYMQHTFKDMVELMRTLLSPAGCPWDREQTLESLKPYILEETYEVLEAIDKASASQLKEELGDLLFQIVFCAELMNQISPYDINDVIQEITEKMKRRHPHVFGEKAVKDSNEVVEQWQRIKEKETPSSPKSLLDGIPKSLPALLKTHQIGQRVARVGFDWPNIGQLIEKIEEELKEFVDSLTEEERERVEEEFGDLLFSVTHLGRFLDLNAEAVLQKANARFTKRFHFMEEEAQKKQLPLENHSREELEALWEKAKEHFRNKI